MKQNQSDLGGPSGPTPYELAKLAAVLYAAELKLGRPGYSQHHALQDGLALWLNASELLEKWRTNPSSVFPPETTPTSSLPEPKSYPVRLDKFLAMMLPHLSGRSADKAAIFRQFLEYRLLEPAMPPALLSSDQIPRDVYQKWTQHFPPGIMYLEANFNSDKPIPFDCCHPRIAMAVENEFGYSSEVGRPKLPTKDDVDRYFTLWNTLGVPDRDSFHYHARSFQTWYRTKQPKELHATKAENAFIGHAQRKLREHLFKRFAGANPTTKVTIKNFPVSTRQMAQLRELNKSRPWSEYKTWNYDIAQND